MATDTAALDTTRLLNCRDLRRLRGSLATYRSLEDNIQIRVARARSNVKRSDRLDCDGIIAEVERLRAFRLASLEACMQDRRAAVAEAHPSGLKDKAHLATVKAELAALEAEVQYERVLHAQTDKMLENSCN